MKKSVLATAVAAAVGAAGVAHAEATVYGRVNTAIDINDINDAEGADSTTDLSGVASRFGIKGETDFGNGFKAFGHYEWGLRSDNENDGGDQDNRIAVVGVKGAFGKVEIGNQWTAYNEQFGTHISPTYSLGYYLYSGNDAGGLFRGSNTIQYTNSFGPLSLGLDVRLDDNGDEGGQSEAVHGDGWGIGAQWKLGNFTIAAAYDQEDGYSRSARDAAAQVGLASVGALGAIAATDSNTNAATKAGAYAPTVLALADRFVAGTEAQRTAVREDLAAGTAVTSTEVDALITALRALATGATYTTVHPTLDVQVTHVLNADQRAELQKLPSGAIATTTTTEAIGAVAATADYAAEVTAAAADEAPDATRTGVALRGEFGDYWATLGWQNYQEDDDERDGNTEDDVESDTVSLFVGGSMGEKNSWLLGYRTQDIERNGATPMAADGSGEADDPTQVIWGVYRNSGGGLRLYYEGTHVENEAANQDGARHLLGMRFDF